jgi:hypothetical protein
MKSLTALSLMACLMSTAVFADQCSTGDETVSAPTASSSGTSTPQPIDAKDLHKGE